MRQDDLEGGSITVTNLGMFGVEEFAAIINPPHAAILAVGAVREEPVVEDGSVVPGSVMSLTLSVDHRPVDGVVAARWLAELTGSAGAPRAAARLKRRRQPAPGVRRRTPMQKNENQDNHENDLTTSGGLPRRAVLGGGAAAAAGVLGAGAMAAPAMAGRTRGQGHGRDTGRDTTTTTGPDRGSTS